MLDPKMLGLRWFPVSCIAFFLLFFSKAFWKWFLVILEWFWEPKIVKKQVLFGTWMSVCFGLRFVSEFGSIWGWFREARPFICMVKTNTNACRPFLGRWEKKRQNDQKIAPKISKHSPKNTKKRFVFFYVFRGRFLHVFWSKTGPPGGARGFQKSEKKWKKRPLALFWFRAALRDRFWMDFEWILDGFGRIFMIFGSFLGGFLGVIFDDFWFVWGRRAHTQLNIRTWLGRPCTTQ